MMSTCFACIFRISFQHPRDFIFFFCMAFYRFLYVFHVLCWPTPGCYMPVHAISSGKGLVLDCSDFSTSAASSPTMSGRWAKV